MDTIKLDIMPHRRYTFKTDLNIDWYWIHENDPEAIEYYNSLDEKYYCFNLDFFEHSAIAFSLVIDRTNIGYYEFDRSRNVWIIAIPKEIVKSWKEAVELARDYINDYNDQINGFGDYADYDDDF